MEAGLAGEESTAMKRIVFLLEEKSMEVFLESLLNRWFPTMNFICISHDGKNDLWKSIPIKLRSWREPGVRFVVVQDNDGGDCVKLKKKLLDLCRKGRREDSIVRIACQELEAWYLGDVDALVDAYGILRSELSAVKRRAPDDVPSPSREVQRLLPNFTKVGGARRMGARVDPKSNRSASFRVLFRTLEQLSCSLEGSETT